MCERKDIAAGLFLIGCKPLPQITRVRAAIRWIGRVRDHLRRFVRTVAIDDDAMHVVARYQRGPLVADESRKSARFVVFLCSYVVSLPNRLEFRLSGPVHQRVGKLSVCKHSNHFERDFHCISLLHTVVPLPALRISKDFRLAREKVGNKPDIVGMIRDHEPVEWPRKLYGYAGRGNDFLAARKTISIFRR